MPKRSGRSGETSSATSQTSPRVVLRGCQGRVLRWSRVEAVSRRADTTATAYVPRNLWQEPEDGSGGGRVSDGETRVTIGDVGMPRGGS